MKKLFALVLSLALVVAFAVPALATGWASIEPAKVYNDITLNVYGLEVTPNTSKLGSLYEELKTPYPVVEGTKLHFLVTVSIPYESLKDATGKLIKAKGLDLSIETSNMKDITYTVRKDNTIIDTAAHGSKLEKGKITVTYGMEAKDVVWSYEVEAKAASDKEAKVVATAGFHNRFDKENDTLMEVYNKDGKHVYSVWNGGNMFHVRSVAKDAKIEFPVANDRINTKGVKIILNDKTEWTITFGSQVTGSLDFYNRNADTWASGQTYDKLDAIYNDIFGFLGFKFADCDYMTQGHFEKFFGNIGEVSASYTWNAGSVIVNPATPDLPQTGDNASIVGFAMVVVAMVAAAVVTFKKVRA